jgi:hypothetical protein
MEACLLGQEGVTQDLLLYGASVDIVCRVCASHKQRAAFWSYLTELDQPGTSVYAVVELLAQRRPKAWPDQRAGCCTLQA